MKTTIKIGQTKMEVPELGIKVTFGEVSMETEMDIEELRVTTEATSKNTGLVLSTLSTMVKWVTEQFIKVNKEFNEMETAKKDLN